MNKKKAYVRPTVEAVKVDVDAHILAGSPAVRPGGSGGGNVSVIPPEEEEDEEISGAKKFNMWSEWYD